MRHRLRPSATTQRGAGTLVVVMMLFFIMSLVAAYASRNLIFEQKTSANNYRATQAFEAAEAGLEWAIAMLNGGRIDAACVSTSDTTKTSFRERYLDTDAGEAVNVKKWLAAGVPTELLPTCVRGADAWICSCPEAGAPVITAPVGTGPVPSFQISFSRADAIAGRPMVRVRSQSCSNYGDRCFDPAGRRSDGLAEVNVLVGLTASLTQTPAAALTVRGNLVAGDARVVNPDGVVVNAGGTVDPLPHLSGPAGSPARMEQMDTSLGMVGTGGLTAGEMMFLATFGMDPKTYRTQPAVRRFTCPVDNCAAALQALAQQHPGRVIWIDGNLDIDGPLTLGSITPLSPVIMIVGGDINVGNAGNVVINGMVYSRGAAWRNGIGSALVRGAFVAEGDKDNNGNFSITGAPAIVFDAGVVDRLKKVQARRVLDFGSVARVPGSWRDFQ